MYINTCLGMGLWYLLNAQVASHLAYPQLLMRVEPVNTTLHSMSVQGKVRHSPSNYTKILGLLSNTQ